MCNWFDQTLYVPFDSSRQTTFQIYSMKLTIDAAVNRPANEAH